MSDEQHTPPQDGTEATEPAVDAELGEDNTTSDDSAEHSSDDTAAGEDNPEHAPDSVDVQLAERTADLQRVTAEFANYRKRIERDRVADRENAKISVLSDLLPLMDDLDRAREHGDAEQGPLKAFSDKVAGILSTASITEFGAEGDEFDPSAHEAVQDDSEGENPVIGAVLRKGYVCKERVIRTAMVTVTSASA